MRLRNVKNKEEILNGSKYLIKNPEEYIGKWDRLFERKQPIYIEIGMGKGKFLIENAIKYPDINFIGIEKYDSVVAKSLPKIPECLTNIVVIRMDALNIDKVFDKEIERIYLNFSDPWPKVRHSMRRLSSRVFLEKYDKIFKGEKNIYLRTDNRDLFTFSLESFSQYGYVLHDINLNLHEIDQPDIITTEYEDKFVEAGLPIYQVVATKE